MNEAVLDASVVIKWFRSENEGNLDFAHSLRAKFEAGTLHVLAPSLLWLEILNAASRRWQWAALDLQNLAHELPVLGFELVEPDLPLTASWAASGLTAYDATYVAAAEQFRVPLITDDAEILSTAPEVAVPLDAQ